MSISEIECILTAYATQIIEDCDVCNEEFLNKFLEAYSLYRSYLIGIETGCDTSQLSSILETLSRMALTMQCRTCGNC